MADQFTYVFEVFGTGQVALVMSAPVAFGFVLICKASGIFKCALGVMASLVLPCVVLSLFGASSVLADTSVSDVIDQCNQSVAQGAETPLLQETLSPEADNPRVRKGVLDVAGGQVFVQAIQNEDMAAVIICTVDGARFEDDQWTNGVAWADVGKGVEAHVAALVPESVIETTKTPDALDLHLYQRQFVDCASDTSWLLGPHYMSDGGFLFPVSIDWRLEGAVLSYLVMKPLFFQTRDKLC